MKSIYAGVRASKSSWELRFEMDGLAFTSGSTSQIVCANKYQLLVENVESIRTELTLSKYSTVNKKIDEKEYIRLFVAGRDLNTLHLAVRQAQESHTRDCEKGCIKCTPHLSSIYFILLIL